MTASKKIAFWTATVLLCLGMLGGGIAQLIGAKPNVEGITRLGFPLYVLAILGIWKILAVVAILVPRYGLLKEWAHAGLFFLLSGGVVSHLVSGEELMKAFPAFIFLCLNIASWYLRPSNRKIQMNNHESWA